ncbi:hypothetical protein D9758_017917 [Tetrapyrgos nigripes]|uniref:FAD/NAD(P)-binding domain-containing protein n=1 Tax=Tetrapyrgos nigripes TaxID=182062 RepID=A0A8H5AZJ9_9AGAR|nr:hypothetical protein D9758_017917 [Tetrapyrgos nigripes]
MSPSATAQYDNSLVNLDIDVLIVGAGFSGVYGLIQLRKLGLNAKIFEAGKDFWRYLLSFPEIYKDWNFKEKFPTGRSSGITSTMSMRRPVSGRTSISNLTTSPISRVSIPSRAPCTTLLVGLRRGVDLRGKKVGVVGTGATGVQVIQEVAPDAEHLTVFQRTPNLALPMVQSKASPYLQKQYQDLYPTLFKKCRETFGGFTYDLIYDKKTLEATPEERRHHYEAIWAEGGFRFWIANYADMFFG